MKAGHGWASNVVPSLVSFLPKKKHPVFLIIICHNLLPTRSLFDQFEDVDAPDSPLHFPGASSTNRIPGL